MTHSPEKNPPNPASLSCPLPRSEYERVVMAHGGGGTLMDRLIGGVFRKAFHNDLLDQCHDSAVFELNGARLAFTTDSFVVSPLFFPGGDIGSLAVHGTVNDLAMSGARPLFLSAGFILEEGLPMETLKRAVESMRAAAEGAGVRIATGDTKVVERGKCDGMYINTSGIGVIEHGLAIAPGSVRPGDRILVNGDLGRHGIAVMASREGLAFDCGLESDSAALADLVHSLLDAGIEIHCLRDCTRGGLASALNEIAEGARLTLAIDETRTPVCGEVESACEMMGFDPFHVANEGRLVAFVPETQAGEALELMRAHPKGAGAAEIGSVTAEPRAMVTVKSRIGATRILDKLSGEQLPRIC